MNKTMLGALLAVTAMATQASTTRDLESSAVVNGTIVVARDGSVQTAVIDNPEKYGQPIADMVRNAALQWHFQPVLRDGEPVVAKATMHARVILKRASDGNYSARINGATFGDYDAKSTDELRQDSSVLPHYPGEAVRNRIQGMVYLSMHVDRSGHVTEAVARQVNLDAIGQNGVLTHYRKVLAEAALQAVRQWTFHIPTTGPLAHRDNWTANVPVNFNLSVWGTAKTERVWETYVPGPFTPAPWVDRPDMSSTDAVADDSVQTEGAGPLLLSRINHD